TPADPTPPRQRSPPTRTKAAAGKLAYLPEGLADFTTYEVKPAVRTFSQLPLTVPAPAYQRRHRPPIVVPDQVETFAQSLPAAVREVLGTPESVTRLLAERWQARRVLTDEQNRLLEQCAQPPTSEEQLADTPVDKDWASRWILDNAAHRGWSPERFAAFDNIRGGGRAGLRGTRPNVSARSTSGWGCTNWWSAWPITGT
uniref:hypothetical protein n=1 Tax=Streptomyces qinglanensis TaxID=943816 RepID=UPI003D70AEB0